MSVRVWWWVLPVLLFPVGHGLNADERLSMTVSPSQSFAPAHLRIHLRIEPSAENRALEVSAESADFFRSSTIELDGDQAPRIMQWDFPALPGGDYEVRSTLFDAGGHERATVCEQAIVIPNGSSDR